MVAGHFPSEMVDNGGPGFEKAPNSGLAIIRLPAQEIFKMSYF
jgi:hypothetical protein